jgi:hypothetical protein
MTGCFEAADETLGWHNNDLARPRVEWSFRNVSCENLSVKAATLEDQLRYPEVSRISCKLVSSMRIRWTNAHRKVGDSPKPEK